MGMRKNDARIGIQIHSEGLSGQIESERFRFEFYAELRDGNCAHGGDGIIVSLEGAAGENVICLVHGTKPVRGKITRMKSWK